jgi:hypothetical protein
MTLPLLLAIAVVVPLLLIALLLFTAKWALLFSTRPKLFGTVWMGFGVFVFVMAVSMLLTGPLWGGAFHLAIAIAYLVIGWQMRRQEPVPQ